MMGRIVSLLFFISAMQLHAQAGWPDPDWLSSDSITVENLERAVQTENVDAVDALGRTALMYIARSNARPELLSVLVDAGADIQKRDNHGRTALMYYVSNNQIEIDTLQYFIASSADVNAADNDGVTVLMTALVKERNQPSAVQAIIDAGADVNGATSYGATPLMYAFYHSGYMNVVKLLLDAGANVNASTHDGLTPLLIAVFSGLSPQDIDFLIEKGADVNVRDANGYTPLKATLPPMQAGLTKAVVTFQILLDAGADFESESWDIQTLEPFLIEAASRGIRGTVDTLLNAGVSANAHNKGGESALMKAVANRSDAEVVRKLLDAGADVNATTATGITALLSALLKRGAIDADVVSLLIEAGADVNVVDRNNRTPMAIAQERNDPKIVELLKEAGARESIE